MCTARLAEHRRRLSGRFTGRLVLDAGSGTGAAASVDGQGARVVAVERSRSMVSTETGIGGPAPGPMCSPCRSSRRFDAAIAGFLNHLAPGPALAELARVVGPGGAVLATWADDEPIR